ncbi:MAG: M48 family metallopeptidase [Shewanella sp.]|nr:M48 family metallopeptidase [Shewanella sp.]MCF1431150.1 M48 family metallopeptidase [Shewanella sp.]MCF1437731.1 M48 family metallopeptidase [Shewanella sp.]MCF1459624.1 M48 family metallopeptidase [Shewanella sp.]
MKKLLPAVMMSLAAMLLSGCDTHTSPTGRNQTLLFSDTDMAQMGRASFSQMKQNLPINRNPALNAYVDCISSRLLRALPEATSQQWEVVVFDSPQVNAFALPGGYIGIYTGMLKVASTPDELAAVIGHEIAHVLSSHGNEQASRSEMKNWGLKAIDWALDMGEVEHRDMVMAALGLGAEVGISLPFGRDQETEADIIGLQLMAHAGFDPGAAIALWQNMARASGRQPFEILSTHPSHDSRIEELNEQIPHVQPVYQQIRQAGGRECRLR